jgi:outer membrane protein OmpA-like peptidoglycan-associated protein
VQIPEKPVRRLASTLLLLGAITACEQQAPLMGDTEDDIGISVLVFFDFDSANLKSLALRNIGALADCLKTLEARNLTVEGFTDRAGSDSYNQDLSLRRANVVKAELVRLGHPPGDITVVGFGEARPLITTADGVREEQNRRVEIRVCPRYLPRCRR